jgi:hypothetical protein
VQNVIDQRRFAGSQKARNHRNGRLISVIINVVVIRIGHGRVVDDRRRLLRCLFGLVVVLRDWPFSPTFSLAFGEWMGMEWDGMRV